MTAQFFYYLEKYGTVVAEVLVNSETTPVNIEYEKNKMIIRNLDGEFPPFVCIQKDGKCLGSYDQVKWLGFNDAESNELQIYRLLDPRFLFKYVQTLGEIGQRDVHFINGFYKIEQLDLPSLLKDYFREEEILQRWISFRVRIDDLLSMSQPDFPPYSDVVTVDFSPFFRNIFGPF